MKKTIRPRPVEANPKYSYDEKGARYYRESEEKSIQYGSRKHYCGILKDVSASFERKISVLDVGCGTGRYFHCLQNVERLLGLDISQSMLDQAMNPVNKDEIQIGDISLSCADIFEVSLPPESYDLIFSVGVLGEDAPFNLQLCNKLHSLLTHRGRLFLTIADIHSRFQRLHSVSPVLKRAFLRRTFSLYPSKIREKLNKKHDSLYMTKNEITGIFKQSAFSSFRLERYLHPAGSGWQGAHFDCWATKE